MTDNEPIAHAWEIYARFIPDTQRRTAQLAFYSGAASLFYTLMANIEETSVDNDGGDTALLDALHAEIERFAKALNGDTLLRSKTAGRA